MFAEECGDPRPQSAAGLFLFAEGIAKDFPYFFFHAALVTSGASLEAAFYSILDVANDQLSQDLSLPPIS